MSTAVRVNSMRGCTAFRSLATTTTRPSSNPELTAKFAEAAKVMIKPAVAQRAAELDHVGTQAITPSRLKNTHEDDWTHTEHRETSPPPRFSWRGATTVTTLSCPRPKRPQSHRTSHQLTHYDTPVIDEGSYPFELHGLADKPASFTMEQIRDLPSPTEPAMMACAGTCRMMQHNRPWTHVPWGPDSTGRSRWTG